MDSVEYFGIFWGENHMSGPILVKILIVITLALLLAN